MQRSPRPLASASFAALFTSLPFSLLASLLATLLAPAASAQQVQWKLNPLTAKYVGLTFGTSGWNAAEAQAVAYGGHLVTIRSAAENQWLIDNFAGTWAVSSLGGPWIGARDVPQEGQFSWTSGEPFTYSSWLPGEPNGFTSENWVQFLLTQNWGWNDRNESWPLRSLVEVNSLPARSWAWPKTYGTGARPSYGCAFDMDGDGDLDYASPDRDFGQVSLWRNEGQGSYAQAAIVGGLCQPQTSVANDWDGDGDQDLLVVDSCGGPIRLLTNLGGGNSWNTQPLGAGISCAHGITLGDVNRDGLIDVVVSSNCWSGTRVFLRQPAGDLAPPQVYGFYPNECQPTLADLNDDGNLDLLIAGNGVRLLRGSHNGTFTDLGDLGNGFSFKVTAADLNNDGHLEILIPRTNDHAFEVWTSTGSAVLSQVSYSLAQSLPAEFAPHWIETDDLDGDGDMDIVIPAANSNAVYLFRNQSGVLVQDQVLSTSSYPVCVQVCDLDGDAKPDVLSSDLNSNSFSVHINQSIFDCNGNSIDDPIDIGSGFALDCNGNGRPDSCDLSFGFSQDSDGDGIPNECEPTLVAIEPEVRAAAQAGTVVVSAVNVPAGAATLTLVSPDLASPVVVPITLVTGGGGPGGAGNPVSASVALPALFSLFPQGFAQDVVLSGSISWTDGLGATQVTGSTPGVFTWDVPEVAGVQPNSVPFDGANAVLIELEQNVVKQGLGAVRFGAQPAVLGNWIQFAGKTLVSAIAPPQPAPGDYPIELEITAGGVTEFTRIESRALIHLGPGIQAISAISGFQGGGEPVTFSLVGFQPGVPVQVAFGDVSVSGSPLGFLAASTLTVLTPLSPVAGVVDLTLTQVLGPGQVKTAVSPAAFEFVPPGVGALNQASGPQAGGQALSLATDGFAPGPITVRLGTTVTQGSVVGSGADQTVSWTSVAASQAGLVNLRLVQGVFDVTSPNAYTFNAPQVLSVVPSQGSWYQPQSLQIQGQNFAPNLAAGVRFSGESPIAGQVLSSNTIQVNLPAGFLKGAGPLGLIVTQAGVNASLPGAFLCLPALTTTLSGSAAQGGQLRYQVQSQQSGFAIALLSAALSPLPLTLPDIHAGFALDFATSFNVGSGGLLVTPTVQVKFPPLSVPPGTTLQAQALALEFGPLGTWYSFTNTVPVLLP